MEDTVESVDQIKQKVLRILIEEKHFGHVFKDFERLKTNDERVMFAYKFLEEHRLHPKFVKDCKSNERSGKYRQFGNEMFKKKKALEAIEFYTKSIALAEKSSENLAIAYANRSAVLFEKKFYNECLKDIERALKNNYPKNLTEKLLKRQENANKFKLESPSEPYHEPTPKIPKNETNEFLQSATNCVKKEYTKTMGRHIIATRDIKVGKIIAVEKSYCSILLEKKLIHCHECLVLCYNTIPCEGCTEALYCSEKCKDAAWERYHKYECKILKMAYMLKMDENILVLKQALGVRHLYQEITSENLEQTPVYRSDRYTEVHGLITNTERRQPAELFGRALTVATLYHLIKENTNFFDGLENGEKVFCGLLLHHNQITACNSITISEMTEGTTKIYRSSKTGAGVYPLISLINHSCSPNIVGIFHGTTLIIYALQNINEGEQLYITYGYHYAVMGKAERQDHLRRRYFFECTCRPCIQDWPLYGGLLLTENLKITIDASDFLNITRCDVETAKSLLKKLIPKARLNWKNPSKERSDIEEVIHQCWGILGNRRKTL